jgi:UDP-N-acetylmuramoyl-tripeptide--D-alanyl-D-alanine ligase
MSVADLARTVGGTVEGDPAVTVVGAEVDSRRLEAGDLFVALPGARCDGHDFVNAALNTAVAALVRRDAELEPPPEGRALVRVDDPLIAYHELARRERRDRSWRVAAVTGSVGKTTVKDFLAALLAPHFRLGASGGNRNNTLGLPAEMLSQVEDIEVFVAEAGMNSPGELAVLGEMLRPEVLVYTLIAPVHAEFFPDLDAIAAAKAELLPWLDPAGTLVINANDPKQQRFVAETDARVLRFGDVDSDARVEEVEDLGLLGSRFRLVLPDGAAEIELALPGRHQAENLLVAAAGASAFGVRAEQVAEVAAELVAPEHRGHILAIGEDISLVDDSYNASPVAMRRLLELLARAPGRRVAVLGEMYELGELAAEAHAQVGAEAAAACDLLVVVGAEDAARVAAGARRAGLAEDCIHTVEDADGAADLLERLLRKGDVVLVKGSRGVGLDRTVAALAGEEVAGCCTG